MSPIVGLKIHEQKPMVCGFLDVPSIWGFLKMGIPKSPWVLIPRWSNLDNLGVYPIFRHTQVTSHGAEYEVMPLIGNV